MKTKFKEIRFGGKDDLSEGVIFTLGMDQVLVPEICVRDMGVLVDCELSCNQQR